MPGRGEAGESREYYSSTRGRCASLRFNKTRGDNGDLSARRKVIRDYEDIWNANVTDVCYGSFCVIVNRRARAGKNRTYR